MSDHILTSSAWNCSFVCEIDGYLGQVQIVPDGMHWLIFIKTQERICQIQNTHDIYRITDILVHPFNDIEEVKLFEMRFAKKTFFVFVKI